MKLADDAIDVCSEAHQRDPRNGHILRDRAEAYILNQDYEKGKMRLVWLFIHFILFNLLVIQVISL